MDDKDELSIVQTVYVSHSVKPSPVSEDPLGFCLRPTISHRWTQVRTVVAGSCYPLSANSEIDSLPQSKRRMQVLPVGKYYVRHFSRMCGITATWIQITDVKILLRNIYDETSTPTQTAFTEWNETINYFQEHCNAKGTHLIIHYPRNVDIMLIKMKGKSHFHFLLRFIGLLKSSLPWRLGQVMEDSSWGARNSHPDKIRGSSRSRGSTSKRKKRSVLLPSPLPWTPALPTLDMIVLPLGTNRFLFSLSKPCSGHCSTARLQSVSKH